MSDKKVVTTRRVVIGTYQTVLDGQPVIYTLKRGPSCRHARLEVARETGLVAVIPKHYDTKRLPVFLEANKRWILYSLKKYCSPVAPGVKRPGRNNTIPYLGQYFEVVRCDDDGGQPAIRIEGNKVVVDSRVGNNGTLSAALEEWYRREAAGLIKDKVTGRSKQLGLTCGRIVIKGMRSRWGSCSAKGNLNFNWKLILLPEPVVDYVVIHELTHLKEMNHSKKFWGLVAKECPDWRERRKWLTKNGREFTASLDSVNL